VIHYFDFSALVKRYIEEPGSDTVESLLQDGIAATSRFTHVEILSAVGRRYRDGDIAAKDHQRIVSSLRRDFDALVVVELTGAVVEESERLLIRHALRAGDALQLASCIVLRERTENQVAFVAFDERCNEAAISEGLKLR
jgi:predicted nucleic acid-binding protein